MAALVGVVMVVVADDVILGGGTDDDDDVVTLGMASSPSSGISGVSTNFNPSANALGFCRGRPPSLAATLQSSLAGVDCSLAPKSISLAAFSEGSVLSVTVIEAAALLVLLETPTSGVGNENLVSVGVRGEGVHERSLSCCLPMIPARWREACFLTTGECGDSGLPSAAAVSLFTRCL